MSKRLYHQFCGVARSLDFIGERWTLLIVRDLLLGPRRYSDLLAGLPGLTTNLLAKRLQSLEEDGIVKKVKLPRPTPSTVYCLTPLGEELESVVLSLCDWGNRFLNHPTEVEQVDLGWTLLRLKLLYEGGFYLTFEIHTMSQVYSVHVGTSKIDIRLGRSEESDLKITGEPEAVREMFFGPSSASEVAARGDLTIEGKFGRWPRVLAAFKLR
jgi:DNA-binding HxlR family transcriptional regulator